MDDNTAILKEILLELKINNQMRLWETGYKKKELLEEIENDN